jgi:hypothetical protein
MVIKTVDGLGGTYNIYNRDNMCVHNFSLKTQNKSIGLDRRNIKMNVKLARCEVANWMHVPYIPCEAPLLLVE